MSNTILLPFQPDAMTPAQLAAVSYLALYSGHAYQLYAGSCWRPNRAAEAASTAGLR